LLVKWGRNDCAAFCTVTRDMATFIFVYKLVVMCACVCACVCYVYMYEADDVILDDDARGIIHHIAIFIIRVHMHVFLMATEIR